MLFREGTGRLTKVDVSARASRSGLESLRPAPLSLQQFANGALSEASAGSVTFPLACSWPRDRRLGTVRCPVLPGDTRERWSPERRLEAAGAQGPGPGGPSLPFPRPASQICASPYLVQAVRAAGKCDAVFKGFSDCLLKLGDSMANYPQGLDDKTNIKTVCTYWEDFHSCTVTALTDCQEGAKDMWDKLRKESKNLNIQGSLFELCGGGNGAAGPLLPALPVLLVSLSAALAAWLSF